MASQRAGGGCEPVRTWNSRIHPASCVLMPDGVGNAGYARYRVRGVLAPYEHARCEAVWN